MLVVPFTMLSVASFDWRDPPARMKATLPGVADTAPYEYYSGYLDAGTPPSGRGKMFFHYICAMAPNWQTMPLSIWYNGGPGAPSTFGLFQEFGPFLLTAESYNTAEYKKTRVPTPLYNPWTWANATSLCEIDSPAPMGASYCTEGNGSATSHGGPSGDPYSCGPWSDMSVQAANHRAHIAFFNEAFPEFEKSQQPVSLVGESYAGVYVPLFADAWLDDPVKGPGGKPINFHGFAVGDGFPACIPQPGKPVDWCVDLFNVGFFKYPNALPGPYWDVEFFHGHSQMSEELHQKIVNGGCTEDELKGKNAPQPPGATCLALIDEMAKQVGFFYAYNLYEACPEDVPSASRRMLSGNTKPRRRLDLSQNVERVQLSAAAQLSAPAWPVVPSQGDGDTGLGAPCLGSAMEDYFALNLTTTALGIPSDNNFIVLDNGIGFNYTTDASFVGYVYEKAIKQGKRILVYEGDSDACGLQTAPIQDIWAPYFGNGTLDADQWTPAGPLTTAASKPLGLAQTQPWRPFGVEPTGRKVQGGFSMAWNDGQITFASIRGAGHLAPLYRPAASFTMMHAYQQGRPMPPAFWPNK
jgi:serine carboxypeptidase-like clade 1